MFKSNLNRQIIALFKMSAFGLIWNILFHSVALTVLVYWAFNSGSGIETDHSQQFNQFWSDYHLFFAITCQLGLILFFKDEIKVFLKRLVQPGRSFFEYYLRGTFLVALMAVGLVLSKQYEFLGFTSQAHLSFLSSISSYSWLLRTGLIFILIFSIQAFIHAVVHRRLPPTRNAWIKRAVSTLTFLGILWVWFKLSPLETLTLALLISWFDDFWESTGFLFGIFAWAHAGLSLKWMGMEFSGLLQLEPIAQTIQNIEQPFLEIPAIQGAIFILWIGFKLYRKRI